MVFRVLQWQLGAFWAPRVELGGKGGGPTCVLLCVPVLVVWTQQLSPHN